MNELYLQKIDEGTYFNVTVDYYLFNNEGYSDERGTETVKLYIDQGFSHKDGKKDDQVCSFVQQLASGTRVAWNVWHTYAHNDNLRDLNGVVHATEIVFVKDGQQYNVVGSKEEADLILGAVNV